MSGRRARRWCRHGPRLPWLDCWRNTSTAWSTTTFTARVEEDLDAIARNELKKDRLVTALLFR